MHSTKKAQIKSVYYVIKIASKKAKISEIFLKYIKNKMDMYFIINRKVNIKFWWSNIRVFFLVNQRVQYEIEKKNGDKH